MKYILCDNLYSYTKQTLLYDVLLIVKVSKQQAVSPNTHNQQLVKRATRKIEPSETIMSFLCSGAYQQQ